MLHSFFDRNLIIVRVGYGGEVETNRVNCSRRRIKQGHLSSKYTYDVVLRFSIL